MPLTSRYVPTIWPVSLRWVRSRLVGHCEDPDHFATLRMRLSRLPCGAARAPSFANAVRQTPGPAARIPRWLEWTAQVIMSDRLARPDVPQPPSPPADLRGHRGSHRRIVCTVFKKVVCDLTVACAVSVLDGATPVEEIRGPEESLPLGELEFFPLETSRRH